MQLDLVDKSRFLRDAALRWQLLQTKEDCEANMLDFAEYMWPVVEPSRPFVRGWVLEAIADHLGAVTDGHIKRLLINVPPGFTKSLMTDVFWPAWEWGPRNRPSNRYVCFSYSSHLTERDNLRCRNVVQSDRYQKLWGDRVKLSAEQFTKVKFSNLHTGWKLATSVGGIGVGERGDRLIIDDPNKTEDMESEARRAFTKLWFTEVIPDRLNSQGDSAVVVIQQRLHDEDVSGIAIERGMGYTHLMVPMYYEPRVYCNGWAGDQIKTFTAGHPLYDANKIKEDKVFWRDPRTEDGELAWPARFPLEVCEQLRNDKGPTAWVGQYQQSPKMRGGNIIKDEYWQEWKEAQFPNLEYVLASLDSAYTEKETNDPSALTIWGVFRDNAPGLALPNGTIVERKGNRRVVLLHAWRKWLEFNKLVRTVIANCTVDKEIIKDDEGAALRRFPVDRLIIEGRASGISVAQEMMRLYGFTGRFGIECIPPCGDKVARVHSIENIFAQKLVYAPNRPFAEMVIDEVTKFPNHRHDDLTDSTSMAIRYLRDIGLLAHDNEFEADEADEFAYRSALQPLY